MVASRIVDSDRVVVTGASGFLGHHMCEALAERGATCIGVGSADYDLRSEAEVIRLYREQKPTVVIHLAADVGGIGANSRYPGRFFYNNLIMGAYMIEQARLFKVKKFVSVGTVCSYPKITEVPFKEDDIWLGYPEPTNAAYGLAKKMQLVQLAAYRKEYGFDGIHVLPSNLYGPFDKFDAEAGHVIPAMIIKFDQAIRENRSHITLWGDGSPSREFLHARDCAQGILQATEHWQSHEPINLGTGIETHIGDLAILLAEITGFDGEVRWDTSKPNGQPRRSLDISRARSIGYAPSIVLEDGLRETWQWYLEQQ